MKMNMLSSWLALAAITLPACPRTTPEPPWCGDAANPCPLVDPNYPEDPSTDGVGSLEGRACRNLRRLGCSEGFRDPRTTHTCYERVRKEEQLLSAPNECVITAQTQDAVRACGTKDTLRFRCRSTSASRDASTD